MFLDHDAIYRTTLRNGVFTYVRDGSGDVSLTIAVPRPALGTLAVGDLAAARAAGLALEGYATAFKQILSALQPGDPASTSSNPERVPSTRARRGLTVITNNRSPSSGYR